MQAEHFIIFERNKRDEPVSFGRATRQTAIRFCREQWESEGKVRTLFVGPRDHRPHAHWTWAQFSKESI